MVRGDGFVCHALSGHSRPRAVAERSKVQFAKSEAMDRYVLIIIYALMLAWFIIMPLDARTFKWSPDFSVWLQVISG